MDSWGASDWVEDARMEKATRGMPDVCESCATESEGHVCDYDGLEFGCDCEEVSCKPWVKCGDGFPVVPADAVQEMIEFFARLDKENGQPTPEGGR